MYSLKQTLDDLLDYAYKDDEDLPRYKKYYVEISNKNLRSKNGDYQWRDKCIHIYRAQNRNDSWITVTAIHELSHHIDHCQRGTSDHQIPFYFIFVTLLRAGLDLGLYSKEDIENVYGYSQSQNKVIDAIRYYKPKNVGYKSDAFLVSAYDCFDKKDLLKSRGYSWNKIKKAWELETKDKDSEELFLKSNGIKYLIGSASLKSYKEITD